MDIIYVLVLFSPANPSQVDALVDIVSAAHVEVRVAFQPFCHSYSDELLQAAEDGTARTSRSRPCPTTCERGELEKKAQKLKRSAPPKRFTTFRDWPQIVFYYTEASHQSLSLSWATSEQIQPSSSTFEAPTASSCRDPPQEASEPELQEILRKLLHCKTGDSCVGSVPKKHGNKLGLSYFL